MGLSAIVHMAAIVPAVRYKSGTGPTRITFTGLSASIRQPVSDRKDGGWGGGSGRHRANGVKCNYNGVRIHADFCVCYFYLFLTRAQADACAKPPPGGGCACANRGAVEEGFYRKFLFLVTIH